MKLPPIIHELIKHIQSLAISTEERYFLNGIIIRDTYTQKERNVLNSIRKKYYDELKKIYTSVGYAYGIDAEAELTSMLSQQIAEEYTKKLIEELYNKSNWVIDDETKKKIKEGGWKI